MKRDLLIFGIGILILIRVIEIWMFVFVFLFWVFLFFFFWCVFNQHSPLKATWWIKSSQTIVMSGLNFALFSRTFLLSWKQRFLQFFFLFSAYISFGCWNTKKFRALPIHWIYADPLIHCFKYWICAPKYESSGLYNVYSVCALLLYFKWHLDKLSCKCVGKLSCKCENIVVIFGAKHLHCPQSQNLLQLD